MIDYIVYGLVIVVLGAGCWRLYVGKTAAQSALQALEDKVTAMEADLKKVKIP